MTVLYDPSARPTSLSVVITIFTWNLFCFARIWKNVETDGRKACVKTVIITTGRDCVWAEWINTWRMTVRYTVLPNWLQVTALSTTEVLHIFSVFLHIFGRTTEGFPLGAVNIFLVLYVGAFV